MQPNEQLEHPIDYLDSISSVPKVTKKGPSNLFFFGAIGAALLISLIVGVFAVLNGGSDTKNLATLSARLSNVQAIADDSQKKIVSSDLRATNTSLSLVLTNINHDFETILIDSGIAPDKLDPKITAAENVDELNKRLEDARLNAVFNRTYAREMTYQLETVLILLKQLNNETKSKSQKEFLTTAYDNLAPLQERFSRFNDASN